MNEWVGKPEVLAGCSAFQQKTLAVVIGHVAAGTSTIRVGAGGVMLPNHAPLVIAEQVRDAR